MSTDLDKARAALAAADEYTARRPVGAMSGVCDRHHLRAALAEVDRLTALRIEREAHSALLDVTRRDRDALRAQVDELQRLGASMHKAADAARKAERADVVAWLRADVVRRSDADCYDVTHVGAEEGADAIERGAHEGAAGVKRV